MPRVRARRERETEGGRGGARVSAHANARDCVYAVRVLACVRSGVWEGRFANARARVVCVVCVCVCVCASVASRAMHL